MNNNPEKKRSYSVLESGRIVVDVRALLNSDRVKKDLRTLRTRIEQSVPRVPDSDQDSRR
jgi:hypothetical protein